MKKLKVIVVIILLIISFTSFIFPLTSAQTYKYDEITYGGLKYDYYHGAPTAWIILYLPGGTVSYDGSLIDGCMGTFDNRTGICSVRPKSDEWVSRLFMDNGIDFIEPQSYKFATKDVWVLNMLHYLKNDLKYNNLLLGGFSGGGAVVASMPTVYSSLQNLVKSIVVYEGPTIMFARGPAASAYSASLSLTKTFMAYGIDDIKVPPENGATYIRNMKGSIPKMMITFPIKHDMTIIVYTLDMLFAFIGKPRPPQYTVETKIISYTTENTIISTMTQVSTKTLIETMTTTAQTLITVQTKIIKSYAPSWETIRNSIILTGWFAGLILCIWFIRNRKKGEAWFTRNLGKYEV